MTYLRVLCILIVLAAAVCGQGSPQILKVKNGGPWGSWGKVEMCPDGSYAGGFSVRMEKKQGAGDDSALNGIRLHCFKGGKSINKSVQSDPGHFGVWSGMKPCPAGLKSFSLKVAGKQGSGDDTAVNNILFACRPKQGFFSFWNLLKFGGKSFKDGEGKWGRPSKKCSKGKVICGLQTKVEAKQGGGDDTALNDVRFYCCPKA